MSTANEESIQSHYPESLQHCYGCGALNARGLKLESHAAGGRVIATFHADAKYHGIPGYAYGGLIASLIDCHAMAAAAHWFAGDDGRYPRTVTAALDVQYLHPTPLDQRPLELSARVSEASGRKAVVSVELSVDGKVTATGRVVAVLLPEAMAR